MVSVSGKVLGRNCARLVQPLKASCPIETSAGEPTKVSSEVRLLQKLFGIAVRPETSRYSSAVQPENAVVPATVVADGNSARTKVEHPLNMSAVIAAAEARMTFVSAEQLRKFCDAATVASAGATNDVIARSVMNARSPSETRCGSSKSPASAPHWRNAKSPIVSTAGIETARNPERPSKAEAPTSAAAGRIALVSAVHPVKAEAPSAVASGPRSKCSSAVQPLKADAATAARRRRWPAASTMSSGCEKSTVTSAASAALEPISRRSPAPVTLCTTVEGVPPATSVSVPAAGS